MALEATFRDLSARLNELDESLRQLWVCFEDKPPKGETHPVQQCGDAITGIVGACEEALFAVRDAEQAVAHPPDLDRARRTLMLAQERIRDVSTRLTSDLTSYERIAELLSHARKRRGEWPGWLKCLRAGLDDCREPLRQVDQSILLCWQEIAERVGMSNITLRATNVGRVHAGHPVETVEEPA